MKSKVTIVLILLIPIMTYSQSVSVNTDGSSPNPSAILDVKSTMKGFLLPRMTTAQRTAITNPAEGLQVFDINTKTFWFYNGNAWTESATGAPVNYWARSGLNIYYSSGNVGIGTGTPQSLLHVVGEVKIGGNHTVEFGAGVAGKEGNAGKIGYNTFGAQDALDIVGAGSLGTNRKIKFWNEGGASFSGRVGIGTDVPDAQLSLFSNVVQSNDNTYLLGLRGRNPIMVFTDENNAAIGYIKSWTHNPYAPFTNGMLIGSMPGYPIYLSTNNYSASMTVSDNGNVGIGTTLPDARLSLFSNVVQSNDNTYLLGLRGRNPTMVFTDENNTAIGYIKSWTHSPYTPFTYGMLIGSIPGYPIFFSTNYALSMIIANNGNVGIGTANPTYKLSVNGNVRSKEVVVESNWADFVFEKEYDLPRLDEVEKFIAQHKHLPGIPSESEIKDKGLSVGEMQSKMMQKIEELTLYLIEANKRINILEQQLSKQKVNNTGSFPAIKINAQ